MNTEEQDIAKYKFQLRAAINNLRNLDRARTGAVNSLNDVHALMSETSSLLESLEKAPIAKITKIIEKRKRKRRKAKLHHKLIRERITQTKIIPANAPTTESNAIVQIKEEPQNSSTTITSANQKSHQQLRSYRDSNRFLRTFELLEILHMARVEDDESTHTFSEKLSKLRSIWNIIRLENLPERSTSQTDLQNQWKTTLFGAQEQSYYKQERSFDDLTEVRRKWDSYITREPNVGSSIPQGLVLPRKNADDRWACYRTQ